MPRDESESKPSRRVARRAARKKQPMNVRLGVFLSQKDADILDEEAEFNELSVSAYLRRLNFQRTARAHGRSRRGRNPPRATKGRPRRRPREIGGGPATDRVARLGAVASDPTRHDSWPDDLNAAATEPPGLLLGISALRRSPRAARARKIASRAPKGARRGRA